MLSPAKASFQRKLAALGSGAPTREGAAAPMPTDGPVATEYQQLLAALQIDMNRLRQIQGTEKKIAAKRDMIGKYLPWLQGALAAEKPAQDEIVGNMLVWSLDLADWDLAYALAAHFLKHGLALPERYKRQPATLIAEQVAEAGLAPTPTVGLVTLQKFDELLLDADMHDQVKAKLYKALGLAFHRSAEAFDPTADNAVAGGKSALLKNARDCFTSALTLDKGAGVKKLIEAIDRELKKATSTETAT
jgi:hypothetical protein